MTETQQAPPAPPAPVDDMDQVVDNSIKEPTYCT